jgi:hypothetical protein
MRLPSSGRAQEHHDETAAKACDRATARADHPVMTESGLITVSPKQAVPPWHIEAEISVGLTPIDRVMHAMHVGRHDKQAQHPIELRRQTDVAVVEHGKGVQHHFEDQHGDRCSAEYENGSKLDQHRDDNFARMKTQSGGDIEFKIRVMHPVHPPKERNDMEHHVLAIDRQIEQQHRRRDCDPGRDRNKVEQAPAPGLGKKRHPHPRKREQQPHNERVQYHETKIVRPTEPASDGLWPTRCQRLPQCHQHQHAKKAAQPYDRLCNDHSTRHARLQGRGGSLRAAQPQSIG